MYVCLCKAVTDTEILQAIEQGSDSLDRLRERLGVATQCGSCVCFIEALLLEKQQQRDHNDSIPFLGDEPCTPIKK